MKLLNWNCQLLLRGQFAVFHYCFVVAAGANSRVDWNPRSC